MSRDIYQYLGERQLLRLPASSPEVDNGDKIKQCLVHSRAGDVIDGGYGELRDWSDDVFLARFEGLNPD
jgi:hypothetical protein